MTGRNRVLSPQSLAERDFEHDDHCQFDLVQTLWAGYGKVLRYEKCILEDGAVVSVIIKYISPPSMAADSVGHKRKTMSYDNEMSFYKNLRTTLFKESTPGHCHIPRSYCLARNGTSRTFVMEDMCTRFPRSVSKGMDFMTARTALRWLAKFHGTLWTKTAEAQNCGISSTGSYWHLDTRMNELEKIEDDRILNSARLVDHWLKSSPFRTLIHGDFKAENLLFNNAMTECAAVDFQYCGVDIPMRDVAYLLQHSCSPTTMKREKELLEFYYSHLMRFLNEVDLMQGTAEKFTFQAMTDQYAVAVTDFYRFTCGWNMYLRNPDRIKKIVMLTLDALETEYSCNEENHYFQFQHLNIDIWG
eukprot:CFRG4035T1